MRKIVSLTFVFLSACSTHADIEMVESTNFKQDNIAYSKIINYWVDGYYDGSGKNKEWVSGYWERRFANPVIDSEYVWESGKWKEVKK